MTVRCGHPYGWKTRSEVICETRSIT